MDFMKVIDQTVREIKREVNLKVLKVPEIEQKVLDATNDEPWGPHGTALQEISLATRKFTECQMIMNVLWTRLGETGKDWRLVYKALSVIEYLVAHGSERAVDDIIEHTFQISSLTSFEYVEPSGKDVGINVRKKAETIVGLLNNQEKIQEARNKAAANRDKYVGLSSSGITSRASSASFGSSSYSSSDRYGGFGGGRDTDGFKDSYKKTDKDAYVPRRDADVKSIDCTLVYCILISQSDFYFPGLNCFHYSKGQPKFSPDESKTSANLRETSKPNSISIDDDLDDDFDPRGNSRSKSTAEISSQVDLFGQSLVGDLLDAPTSVPAETSVKNGSSADVDLFADADFVSAEPQVDKVPSPQAQVDLFASQPAIPAAAAVAPSAIDFFSAGEPPAVPESKKPVEFNAATTSVVDPFAALPINSFDGSDLFGDFSSSTTSGTTEPTKNPPTSDAGTIENPAQLPPKNQNFQVKSGIWADSLSRGIIDLNISAPKKISLVDVGVMGDLGGGQEEKEKSAAAPPTFYMGRAMGSGSGLGMSGFTTGPSSGFASSQPQSTPAAGTGADQFFSSLGGSQQYQFGAFK
ncbi:unnamed protein product [Linum tenue]|uniref:ENTH domain-containing protein n=1 Tax=Linum tenue TaxID=586396 RepID=A0AAV0JI28_9ROSI|nr:unnamed protein product [Linum tenue]CAI0409099.1 unnamed protein product [Linum tenue]CAI0409516.1 unnamed protein product [Linum tenue]